jgi:serralysin
MRVAVHTVHQGECAALATGNEGLAYSGAGDNSWGVRVAIGGSSQDWYSKSGAGGVAYLNSFNNTSLQPTFVFSKNLGNGFPKYVWEAVSHEVGHTLGLNHDGSTTVGYYEGHGDWAPIMGVGYYRPISQWSKVGGC